MMTREQMISEYTSIFNACQSLSELYDVVSGIDFGALDGVTVAGITDAAEVAEKTLQAASAARQASGRSAIAHVAKLVASYGNDETADYINNRMRADQFYNMCFVLGCRFDAREAMAAIAALVPVVSAEDNAADAAEFDRIFAAGRGTVRLERGDYVIIAHCQTSERIEVVLIRDTRWYVSVNYNGDLIDRTEFAASLRYAGLIEYVNGVIINHSI